MKYSDYSLEDFLKDEFFKNWVLGLDTESDFFWKKWISEHPDQQKVVLKAKELITSISYRNEYKASSKEYIDVLENIYKQSEASTPKKWFNISWLRYAAILIITSIGIYLFHLYSTPLSATKAETAESVWNVIKNPKGQKNLLRFPDGSQIKLNSSTVLKYPKSFAKDARMVYLEGEAFFDIARDTSRPFIINIDSVQVEVLGTSFNIKANPTEDNIQVTVESGKVKVNNKATASSILLDKNEAAIYQRSKSKLKKESIINLEEVISWKDGVLIFNKASFREVISELEKWYNVEFIIEKGVIVSGKYNGRFNNTSLELVLQGIDFSSNLNYKIEGNKVYISK